MPISERRCPSTREIAWSLQAFHKSTGLNALAYNNLTNDTYGEGGGLARLIGYVLIGMGILFGVFVIPLPLIPIGIWVWWMGRRAKKALALCRQVTTAGAPAQSAA